MMNINEYYNNELSKLKKKYISILNRNIKQIIRKTKPSQFDDRYMAPFIQTLMDSYKNEFDTLSEKMERKILDERYKLDLQIRTVSTTIHELLQTNQEIEEFFEQHQYPYHPYQSLSSKVSFENPFDPQNEMVENKSQESNVPVNPFEYSMQTPETE